MTEKLTGLVLRAVARMSVSQAGSVDPSDGRNAAPAEVMLAVLTFCYASGLYSSRDIAESILARRIGRKFLDHVKLDWVALRQFRRRHREWIKLCLATVLAGLSPTHSTAVAMDGTARDDARLAASASTVLLNESDIREAERRLDLAVQWDSLEGD